MLRSNNISFSNNQEEDKIVIIIIIIIKNNNNTTVIHSVLQAFGRPNYLNTLLAFLLE